MVVKSSPFPGSGRRLAPALVVRVAALFGVLATLKFFVLLATRAQLYEEKWRYTARAPGFADRLALLLVAAMLVAVGCQTAKLLKDRPPARVRTLTLCLLFFGFLFYLVGRNVLGQHYLVIWAHGSISPRELGAYVFMDFFDRPPYLGLAAGALLVAWGVLWRLNREWLLPIPVALVAGLHLLGNYWQGSIGGGKAIMVATVGVTGWLATALLAHPRLQPLSHQAKRHAHLLTQGATLALLVGMFLALWAGTNILEHWPPFLTIHLAASLCLAALLWWLVGRLAGQKAMPNLPFVVAVYLFFGNGNYHLADNYSALFIHSASLPSYWSGDVALCLALTAAWALCPAAWGAWPRRVFDLVAVLCLLLGTLDWLVLRLTGIRLSWQLATIADDFGLAWNVVREFVTPSNFLALVLPPTAYFILVAGFARWRPSARRLGASLGVGLIANLVLATALAVAGRFAITPDKAHGQTVLRLLATSPLTPRLGLRRPTLPELLAEADFLGFPRPSESGTGPEVEPREWNVLLVILESMHCRHLSLFDGEYDTLPLLSQYADRMHLFGNFYAPFPNSNHARFSIFNGLYSTREYVSYLHPRIACPSIPEILQANGWTTSLFYSSTRNYTRLADYLEHRGWDFFHDESNMPLAGDYPRTSWGVHEFTVLANMRRQIARHAANDERFFLSYIPASPHRPFDDALPEFKVFDEGVPTLDGNYVGRYKNLLLQMDWLLHTLINDLETLGLLDNTVVLLTSDHGEFLGEDGRIGHGWSVEPSVARIPFIVMRPDDPTARVYDRPGSHVDVLPTLLDILRLPLPPGHFYQGVSLYRTPSEPRFVYLSSYDQRAIVYDHHFLLETSGASHRSPMSVSRLEPAGAAINLQPVTGAPPLSRENVANRLDRFERFQQSLVMHYESYLRELRASER